MLSQASDRESPCPVAVTPRSSRVRSSSEAESTDNMSGTPVTSAANSPAVCSSSIVLSFVANAKFIFNALCK